MVKIFEETPIIYSILQYFDKSDLLKLTLVNKKWRKVAYFYIINLYKDKKELYLHDNKLKKIPKELGKLTNLEYLFLNGNHLEEIPKELGNLTNLKELYLNGNNLETIPKELGSILMSI